MFRKLLFVGVFFVIFLAANVSFIVSIPLTPKLLLFLVLLSNSKYDDNDND